MIHYTAHMFKFHLICLGIDFTSLFKGKGKVVPVLDQAPRLEDV
jgi:hypothetical protein